MLARFVLASAVAGLVFFAAAQATGQEKEASPYAVPYFRHIDPDAKAPNVDHEQHLTFIADADFPPFSYADAGGEPKGLAVDVALALCAKLSLQCTV